MSIAANTKDLQQCSANNVTAVVLTRNEEDYIADCLESLSWCNNVIVLDSFSTDHTVEIAQELGVQAITHPFRNFADQHNVALDYVDSEWVLFVDADERVSPKLADEISKVIYNRETNGYWIPTHNFQMGKLILHSGLYPDYHLRLFRKGKGYYDPKQIVHEQVILEGNAGYLENPLIHISCDTWADFIDHQKKWMPMKAEIQYERGIKPTYHFVVGPILEFLRRYVYLKGYRDGLHGLYLSWIFAYYYFVMFVELRKLWKHRPQGVSL